MGGLDYYIRIFLTCFPIYLLVYFKYFNVRKPTFLYYRLSLVSKSFACCLKSRAFFPDFNHSFILPFLFRVAPKITAKCKFFYIGVSYLSDCLVRRLCT